MADIALAAAPGVGVQPVLNPVAQPLQPVGVKRVAQRRDVQARQFDQRRQIRTVQSLSR
jgi:hypothetical protein